MNPIFLSTILLFLVPTCILGQEVDSKSALTSFLGFLKEARQDEAAAITFSKPGEKIAAAERIKKLIELSKAHQNTVPEFVESKELGTVARVIVKDAVKRPDGKPDYDGILLVKREREYGKSFLKPTNLKTTQDLRKRTNAKPSPKSGNGKTNKSKT